MWWQTGDYSCFKLCGVRQQQVANCSYLLMIVLSNNILMMLSHINLYLTNIQRKLNDILSLMGLDTLNTLHCYNCYYCNYSSFSSPYTERELQLLNSPWMLLSNSTFHEVPYVFSRLQIRTASALVKHSHKVLYHRAHSHITVTRAHWGPASSWWNNHLQYVQYFQWRGSLYNILYEAAYVSVNTESHRFVHLLLSCSLLYFGNSTPTLWFP